MRREELVMEIIGGLDDRFIAEAMPRIGSHERAADTRTVIEFDPAEIGGEITKKDRILYWVTHSLGVAAAAFLIIGAAVLLIMNWDKIAVREPDRPGVITTISEPVVTSDSTITEPAADRFEQITDTSMPMPFEHYDSRINSVFFDMWKYRFTNPTNKLLELSDSDKDLEIMRKSDLIGGETPYRLDDNMNLYWWMNELGLSFDDVCRAIEENNEYYRSQPFEHSDELIFNPYEIDVLKGGDRKRIAEAFASEYSIVVGENVFSPKWLYYHTIEDYKAAGIPTAELNHKMSSYNELGLTDEAWSAFKVKLSTYVNSSYGADTLAVNIADNGYSFSEKTFGIFEDVFYGEWEPAEGNNADQNIILTYSKDMFTFENWIYPFGILENDEAYVMPYMSGGVPECLIIRKDDPRVLYKGWWNRTDSSDYYTEPTETFTVDPGTGKYKRINDEPYDRELHTGEIGVWGLHKLICGGEQSAIRPRFETETYYTIPGGFYGGGYSVPGGFEGKGYFTDENGTEWVISGTKALGASKVYYLGGDGITSLTLGIRYYEKAAYETYINEHIDDAAYEPKEQYFAVSFTVDENGICRTSYSPYETEKIIEVKKPGKKIELSVNTVLDLDAVTADYTYKLIDDYESNENWQYMKEWVESAKTELAAERRDFYRSTDYFGYPDYDIQYIGNDACDYVIRKMFGFTDIVQYNSWEMFIFVKDGKAVGATDIMKRSGLNWYVDGNDLYEVATTENILHIDLSSFEYDWIPIKEGYSTIADINDDWFICGNGPLYAYNRHTGEIINTGTEWNGLNSNLMRLNGDRIEYTGEPGTGYWYDIVTGESGEDPQIFNTPIHFVFENIEYKAHSYYNTTAEPSAEEFDFSRISMTRKSDGLTKVFSFENLIGGRSGETDGADLNHFFIGDWFITRLNNYGRVAVNFETGESAAVNDIMKENKIWSHTVCGDRNFVEFTDDTGTAHLFGEIVFDVISE